MVAQTTIFGSVPAVARLLRESRPVSHEILDELVGHDDLTSSRLPLSEEEAPPDACTGRDRCREEGEMELLPPPGDHHGSEGELDRTDDGQEAAPEEAPLQLFGLEDPPEELADALVTDLLRMEAKGPLQEAAANERRDPAASRGFAETLTMRKGTRLTRRSAHAASTLSTSCPWRAPAPSAHQEAMSRP